VPFFLRAAFYGGDDIVQPQVIPQLQALLAALIDEFFGLPFALNEQGIFIRISQRKNFLDGRAERRAAQIRSQPSADGNVTFEFGPEIDAHVRGPDENGAGSPIIDGFLGQMAIGFHRGRGG
jgi:hypothetical protein